MDKIMKNSLCLTLLFLISMGLILFASCNDKESNDIPKLGSIEGVVLDVNDHPIEKVKIWIGNRYTETGSNGYFKIGNAPVGLQTINFSKENYISEKRTIEIVENETQTLNLTLQIGSYIFQISDSLCHIPSYEANLRVEVNCNYEWTVENNTTWIKTSSEKGYGNEILVIRCDENNTSKNREDSILIISNGIKKSIKIEQFLKFEITSIKGLSGNNVNETEHDSIFISYSIPILEVDIQSTNFYCQCPMDYNIIDGGRTLRFSYDCAAIGGNYPFNIAVKNVLNERLEKNISVPFYKRKIEFEGNIDGHYISRDEKRCYVTTYKPHRLYVLSLEDYTILKTFDLDFFPGCVAYNGFNDKVYISGYSFQANMDEYSNKLYVVNPHNGQTEKVITIEPDSYDHPQFPSIYVTGIEFTVNGKGLIVLMNNQGGSGKWEIIDSRDNNRMYYHDDFLDEGGIVDYYFYFTGMFLNPDGTKILGRNRTRTLFIYDSKTDDLSKRQFVIYGFWAGSTGMVKMNKNDWRFFLTAYPFAQEVWDAEKDTYSGYTEFESRSATADFSYREEDQNKNIIYYSLIDDKIFHIFDYDKMKMLYMNDIVWGFENMKFLNNNDLLFTNSDGNSNAALYFIDTDDFQKKIH